MVKVPRRLTKTCRMCGTDITNLKRRVTCNDCVGKPKFKRVHKCFPDFNRVNYDITTGYKTLFCKTCGKEFRREKIGIRNCRRELLAWVKQ